jgi:hypothetical protein
VTGLRRLPIWRGLAVLAVALAALAMPGRNPGRPPVLRRVPGPVPALAAPDLCLLPAGSHGDRLRPGHGPQPSRSAQPQVPEGESSGHGGGADLDLGRMVPQLRPGTPEPLDGYRCPGPPSLRGCTAHGSLPRPPPGRVEPCV